MSDINEDNFLNSSNAEEIRFFDKSETYSQNKDYPSIEEVFNTNIQNSFNFKFGEDDSFLYKKSTNENESKESSQNNISSNIEIQPFLFENESTQKQQTQYFKIFKVKKMNRKERIQHSVNKIKERLIRKIGYEKDFEKLSKERRRKIQNRISAQKSRDRQKQIINNLKLENLYLKDIISKCEFCKEKYDEKNTRLCISDISNSSFNSNSFSGILGTFSAICVTLCVLCMLFNPKSANQIRKLNEIEQFTHIVNISKNYPALPYNNASTKKNDSIQLNEINDYDNNIKEIVSKTNSVSNMQSDDSYDKNYYIQEIIKILQEHLNNKANTNSINTILQKRRKKFLISLVEELQKNNKKNGLRSSYYKTDLNYCTNFDNINYNNIKQYTDDDKYNSIPSLPNNEYFDKLNNKVESIFCTNYMNSEFLNNELKLDEMIEKNKDGCLYMHLILPVHQKESNTDIMIRSSNKKNENNESKINNEKFTKYYELGCKIFEINKVEKVPFIKSKF